MAVYLGSQNVGVGVITKLQAQVNNEDITITENGIYTKSSEDFTGLGTVVVDIPIIEIKNENITITKNGIYTKSSEDFTGLGTVTVNVIPDTSDLPLIPTLKTDFNYMTCSYPTGNKGSKAGNITLAAADFELNSTPVEFNMNYIPTNLTYIETETE